MQSKPLQGSISFIHHEKEYVTIDYVANGKARTINGLVGNAVQQGWIKEKLIRKKQLFRMGDEVSFVIVPTKRGDKMVADQIIIRYNNALTNLLHKAAVENKFTGYLKKVCDRYFVKETASYITLPLLISPWEDAPPEAFLNEPIFFQLENFTKADKVTASLIEHQFIPAYKKALLHFNKQIPVNAVVTAVKVFGIHVKLFEAIEAKCKLNDKDVASTQLKVGDNVRLKIDFLSAFKIVVSSV